MESGLPRFWLGLRTSHGPVKEFGDNEYRAIFDGKYFDAGGAWMGFTRSQFLCYVVESCENLRFMFADDEGVTLETPLIELESPTQVAFFCSRGDRAGDRVGAVLEGRGYQRGRQRSQRVDRREVERQPDWPGKRVGEKQQCRDESDTDRNHRRTDRRGDELSDAAWLYGLLRRGREFQRRLRQSKP